MLEREWELRISQNVLVIRVRYTHPADTRPATGLIRTGAAGRIRTDVNCVEGSGPAVRRQPLVDCDYVVGDSAAIVMNAANGSVGLFRSASPMRLPYSYAVRSA